MSLHGSSLLVLLIAYAASVHAAQTSEKSAVIRGPNSIRIAGEPLADLPVAIASALDGGLTRGEVSGQLSFPYSTVRNTLRRPPSWCAILVLHQNVKACTYADAPQAQRINVYVGTKEFQSVEQASLIQYAFNVEHESSDELTIRLHAPHGPIGTRNYEIRLRVAPQDASHTFMRLEYQYELGTRGKLALNGYLNTAGRAKVGFTALGTEPDGSVRYVSGIRGVTERNVVRYFFAIIAYLECLNPSGAAMCDNFPTAAERWFELTARFPRQLFELSQEEYLRNKRQETAQQSRLQGVISAGQR